MRGRVVKRGARRKAGRAAGVGLAEFLVALLLFSAGVLGLLSSQIAGQRATHSALQHTVALVLAQDLLARVEANPRAVDEYAATDLVAGPAHTPEVDCRHAPCTPIELAHYDLWEVASGLGAVTGVAGASRLGRLHGARACVQRAGREVTVTLTWQGRVGEPGAGAVHCGADGAPPENPGRRQVVFSARLASVT